MIDDRMKNLIKAFINDTYKSQSTREQYQSRLKRCIEIFEQHGITDFTTEKAIEILKSEIPEKNLNVHTRLVNNFNKWRKLKGEKMMTENEININNSQEHSAAIDTVQIDMPLSINQSAKIEQTERKVGKPVTTGRSEKFSLYVTKETAKQIEALRIYDEIDLQDLLNEAIQVYFQTRNDDLDFLKSQEQARQQRKAQRLNQD